MGKLELYAGDYIVLRAYVSTLDRRELFDVEGFETMEEMFDAFTARIRDDDWKIGERIMVCKLVDVLRLQRALHA